MSWKVLETWHQPRREPGGPLGGPKEALHRRRPLLHPTRWPVVAGTVIVTVGAFLSWQTTHYPESRTLTITGASMYAAPGLQLMLFAVATLVACALPSVAGTRTRTVQQAPAVLGVVTLVLAVQQYRLLAPEGVLTHPAGTWVVLEGGFWTSLAGSVLVALGGVATSYLIAHDRPLIPEPSEFRADLSFVRAIVALFLGFCVAIVAVVMFVPTNSVEGGAIGGPLVVGGGFAAALGLYAAWERVRSGRRGDR